MPKVTLLHSFVDESGDDGFSAGATDWLIIAAVIFEKSYLSKVIGDWNICKVARYFLPALVQSLEGKWLMRKWEWTELSLLRNWEL